MTEKFLSKLRQSSSSPSTKPARPRFGAGYFSAQHGVPVITSLLVVVFAVAFLGGSSSTAETKTKVPSKRDSSAARTAKTSQEKPAPAAAAKAASAPAVPAQGCVSCHAQIEPMHRTNQAGKSFDQLLEGGKDARGVTCTACHGGNPVPGKTSDDPKEIERVKRTAHVQPR